jgi:hypothetical protein
MSWWKKALNIASFGAAPLLMPQVKAGMESLSNALGGDDGLSEEEYNKGKMAISEDQMAMAKRFYNYYITGKMDPIGLGTGTAMQDPKQQPSLSAENMTSYGDKGQGLFIDKQGNGLAKKDFDKMVEKGEDPLKKGYYFVPKTALKEV